MHNDRYQNDRHFVWYFYQSSDRRPFILDELDISLEVQVGLTRIPITEFTVLHNTLDFVFRGRDQKRPGPIILTMYINKGRDDMITIDAPGGMMTHHSIPGAGVAPGAETSSGEIVSFVGEWVDDRVIPASIARKTDLSEFVTKAVDDLVNYYLKSETFTKEEILSLVATIQGVSFVSVAVRPEASSGTTGKIYLVPAQDPQAENVKDEFITVETIENGQTVYSWEKIGSTRIDLTGLVTIEGLNAALAGYTTTEGLMLLLSSKQDTIADIETIRSGAASGSTAYQKPSSGIPSADLSLGVKGSLERADSAYQKPGTGIPGTDLAADVRSSLAKADTALQAHQDLTPITEKIPATASAQNQLADKAFVNSSIATATADFKGTFLSLASLQAVAADNNDYGYVVSTDADGNTVYNRYKYNGSAWVFEYALNNSSFTAAEWAAIQSGITAALVAKLNAIETGAQVNVLEGVKVNGTALTPTNKVVDVPVPSVPTISTNIQTDKASDLKTASPKAVYDEVHPATGSSQPAGGMLPNVLYKLGTLTGTVTFTLATASDASVVNHWYWTFETGTTEPTINWPAAIVSWFGGSAPTINANKHYEVSLMDGVAVCMEV